MATYLFSLTLRSDNLSRTKLLSLPGTNGRYLCLYLYLGLGLGVWGGNRMPEGPSPVTQQSLNLVLLSSSMAWQPACLDALGLSRAPSESPPRPSSRSSREPSGLINIPQPLDHQALASFRSDPGPPSHPRLDHTRAPVHPTSNVPAQWPHKIWLSPLLSTVQIPHDPPLGPTLCATCPSSCAPTASSKPPLFAWQSEYIPLGAAPSSSHDAQLRNPFLPNSNTISVDWPSCMPCLHLPPAVSPTPAASG